MPSPTPVPSLAIRLVSVWRELSALRRVAIATLALVIVVGVSSGAYLALRGSGPLPDCTPRFCVEVLSPQGDDVDPMTPVRIRLRGITDRDAAQRALTISHQPQGRSGFEGEVLTFRPDWPGFARGVSYDVKLMLDVTTLPPEKQQEPLEITASFTVGGKLAVSTVFPDDGTKKVPADAELFVQFSRSVAPLAVLTKSGAGGTLTAAGPEGVIVFEPAVEGSGRWLNTSLYVYKPGPDGWAPSTAYTARVKAGLTTQLGSQLDEDYVFGFSTVSPSVASVEPAENSKYVAPLPEVRVVFNQPVDRTQAESRFSLSMLLPSQQQVSGTFEWPDDRTLVFRPNEALPLGMNLQARVDAGVAGLGTRTFATTSARSWRFTTSEQARIVSTSPANLQTNADDYGIRLQFATPMDRKSVDGLLVIEPRPESDPFLGWSPDELTLNAGVRLKPSTLYRVTLSTAATDRYGIALDQPLDITFTTRAMSPNARIFRSGSAGTFNAYLDPTVMVTSWNVNKLDFALYRLTQQEFLTRIAGDGRPQTPVGTLLREWSEALSQPPLNQPVVTNARLDGTSRLEEGFYLVRLNVPGVGVQNSPYGNYDELPIVISSVNLTTKWTESELLVWAIDLHSGAPYQGWRFDVSDRAGKRLAGGTTDAQGIARIEMKTAPNEVYPGVYVSARHDHRVVFTSTNWNAGINSYNFGGDMPFNFHMPDMVGHLYTDRPIYRPGETVYVKGVVREDDDAAYSLPAGLKVQTTITDSKGRRLDSQNIELSDFGTFDLSLALSPEAPLGDYRVSLETPRSAGDASGYGPAYIANVPFKVAEFRRPEFEVSVKTDRESYVNGETINATVEAKLFFGVPVANANVRWVVTGTRYTFRSQQYSRFNTGEYQVSFGGCGGGTFLPAVPQQFFRQEGKGRTGVDGLMHFSLPADVGDDVYSQSFTVEAWVTDESNQQVAEFINVPVHKGRFYIGLQPAEYSPKAARGSRVNLVTIDPYNRLVPNVPIQVEVYDRQWRTVRERAADGQQTYKSVADDTLLDTFNVASGPDGKGTFSYTPRSAGQYYLVARAKDDLGNTVRSSLVTWASGDSFASWHIPNDDRFTLVPDQEEYKPGDTARILVAAPFEGASIALVSQERGKLMAVETRRVNGNSEVLELPIVNPHVPNFFLSVILFKPPTETNPMPQIKFGLVKLNVATDAKKLNISLESNSDRFQPRDTVSYSVRTTDGEGRGVPAELSLALVDKAVLTLADDPSKRGMEAFWSRRPLGVITGSTYTLSVDRANELAKSVYPGGKGGGGGAPDESRTFFPNTAFWEPKLRTDASGRATVEVKLPDTLTTWRLTARGITGADTRTGEAMNDVIAAQDLILRPTLPRFLTAGDEALIGGIVSNLTQAPLDVTVSLAVEGVELQDAPERTVSVAPGRSAVVQWPVKAPLMAGEATFTVSATGGTVSDSVTVKAPVYTYFTPEAVSTAGEVTTERTESIFVPSYAMPAQGGLQVNVTPSLLTGVQMAYKSLQERPFESAEATTSRIVAAMAVERAVRELKLDDIEPTVENTKALSQRALQKLYGSQSSDGGWGWYTRETSDPMTSAYVLAGLGELKRFGISIDANVERRAARYLLGQLDRPRDVRYPEQELRAYMLYALARDGQGDLGRTYALAEKRSELNDNTKALLALALKLAGAPDNDPRLTSLVADLQTSAIASANGSHWEQDRYTRPVYGNSTTVTVRALRALTAIKPDHPLVDSTVRWLMISRKEGRWESTYNTANALLAITDVMLARKDVKGNYEYSVALNGETKLDARAHKGQVHQDEVVSIGIDELKRDSLNDLLIKRDGAAKAGRLYYESQLRYYTPAADLEAASRGISVSHEYFREDLDATTPVREVEVGDMVRVKLTLVAPATLKYVVLEDFLPAGLEAIDSSLQISPLEVRRKMEEAARASYQVNRKYMPFSGVEVRDNRVALFAGSVSRGVYEYTYFARATTAGTFHVPPATAYEQYFPDVFGRSDGGLFIVKAAGSEGTK